MAIRSIERFEVPSKLRATNILSAQPGSAINHRAIVLIDPIDLPSALRLLEREGIRASVN
jgi:hypothetical protein